MNTFLKKRGATSQIVNVFVRNSSTGAGLTGLVFNTAGLTAYYTYEGDSASHVISLQSQSLGGWVTGGWVAVDATNQPGVYQLGIPNAALANGSFCTIVLRGASTMLDCVIEIVLTVADLVDNTVNFGLSALPTANPGVSGGLAIVDANLSVWSNVKLTGTASAGAAQSITIVGGSTNDQYYRGDVIRITSGVGAGQSRFILSYKGSTLVAIVHRPWVTNPNNTSVFVIESASLPQVASSGIASAGGASTLTLLTGDIAADHDFEGCVISIVGGAGINQTRIIQGSVASTRVVTVDKAWDTAVDNTSVYVIWQFGRAWADVFLWAGATPFTYTAPDNTSIAAIKVVTDLFRFHGNVVKADVTEVVDTVVASIADFKADVSALATTAALTAAKTVVDAIKAVTDKFGFTGAGPYLVNSQTQGMDADVLGSSQLATSAVTEIVTAVFAHIVSTSESVDTKLARLDVALSTLMTAVAYTAPLNAAATATAVQTGLTSQGYSVARAAFLDVLNGIVAALQSGLATTAQLNAQTTHGDTAWATATGFATTNPDNVGIAAIQAKTDNLPAAPASQVDVTGARDAVETYGASHWATATGFATTNPDNAGIAAIKLKTDNLPATPASQSDVTGARDAVETYGASHWVTATGFATVNPDNADIAAIKVIVDRFLFNGDDYVKADVEALADAILTAIRNGLSTLALDDLPPDPLNATQTQAAAVAALTEYQATTVDDLPIDFLAADIPGSYASGTAGWYLSLLSTIVTKVLLITAENTSFVGPVDPLTNVLTIVRGDSYTNSSGRSVPQWSRDDWDSLDLLHATHVKFKVKSTTSGTIFSKEMNVLSATQVAVQLTSTETTAFSSKNTYEVEVTLLSGDIVTIVQGELLVTHDIR